MEGGGEVYALGDGQLLRTDLDRQAEPCQGEVPLRHREEVGAHDVQACWVMMSTAMRQDRMPGSERHCCAWYYGSVMGTVTLLGGSCMPHPGIQAA